MYWVRNACFAVQILSLALGCLLFSGEPRKAPVSTEDIEGPAQAYGAVACYFDNSDAVGKAMSRLLRGEIRPPDEDAFAEWRAPRSLSEAREWALLFAAAAYLDSRFDEANVWLSRAGERSVYETEVDSRPICYLIEWWSDQRPGYQLAGFVHDLVDTVEATRAGDPDEVVASSLWLSLVKGLAGTSFEDELPLMARDRFEWALRELNGEVGTSVLRGRVRFAAYAYERAMRLTGVSSERVKRMQKGLDQLIEKFSAGTMPRCYHYLGNVEYYLGSDSKALRAYQSGYAAFERLGYRSEDWKGRYLQHLSFAYFGNKEYPAALHYAEQALQIREKLDSGGTSQDLGIAFRFAGRCHYVSGAYRLALDAYQRSDAIYSVNPASCSDANYTRMLEEMVRAALKLGEMGIARSKLEELIRRKKEGDSDEFWVYASKRFYEVVPDVRTPREEIEAFVRTYLGFFEERDGRLSEAYAREVIDAVDLFDNNALSGEYERTLLRELAEERNLRFPLRLIAASKVAITSEAQWDRWRWENVCKRILKQSRDADRESCGEFGQALSWWLERTERLEKSPDWLEWLTGQADEAGMRPVCIASLCYYSGLRCEEIGRLLNAREILENAYKYGRKMSDEEKGSFSGIPSYLANFCYSQGDFKASLRWRRKAREWEKESIDFQETQLARILLILGRFDEAIEHVDRETMEAQLAYACQTLYDFYHRDTIVELGRRVFASDELIKWELPERFDSVHFQYLRALHETDRLPEFAQSIRDILEVLSQGQHLQWLKPEHMNFSDWQYYIETDEERREARDLEVAVFLDRARHKNPRIDTFSLWREPAIKVLLEVDPEFSQAASVVEEALKSRPDDIALLVVRDLLASVLGDTRKAEDSYAHILSVVEASTELLGAHFSNTLAQYDKYQNFNDKTTLQAGRRLRQLKEWMDQCPVEKFRHLSFQALKLIAEHEWDLEHYEASSALYAELFEKGQGVLPPADLVNYARSAGNAYTWIEKWDIAAKWHQRSIEMWRQIALPSSEQWRDLIRVKLDLADAYKSSGVQANAELILDEISGELRAHLAPDDLLVCRYLRIRSSLAYDRDDYESALEYIRQAWAIAEDSGDVSEQASCQNWFGILYRILGRTEEAITAYKNALDIRSDLSEDHPTKVVYRNNLAAVLRRSPDTKADALEMLRANLEIEEKRPALLRSPAPYFQLGFYYLRESNLELAETCLEKSRALRDLQGEPGHSSLRLDESGAFVSIYHRTGRTDAAREEALAYKAASEHRFLEFLVNSSAREQTEFLDASDTLDYLALTGSVQEMAEHILRTKGIVLESSLRAETLSEDAGFRQRGERIKRELIELEMGRKTATKEDLARMRSTALLEERRFFGGATADRIGAILETTVADVCAVIPQQSALLEFFAYDDLQENGRWESHFGVMILQQGGLVEWIDLGPQSAVRDSVVSCRNSFTSFAIEATKESPSKSEIVKSLTAIVLALKTLSENVWTPIRKIIPSDVDHLYLSTEGEIAGIPFAILSEPDEAKSIVIERYELTYLQSGRDLLQPPPNYRLPVSGHFTAFVDPAYGSFLDQNAEADITQLPSFVVAAKEYATHLRELGWTADVYTGGSASELNLGSIRAPDILHLGTHGFYTAGGGNRAVAFITGNVQSEIRALPRLLKSDLPMYRSGLLMAGVEDNLDPSVPPNSISTRDDGILTAAEVSLLDLDDVFLVTLAACSAGAGDFLRGEGVFGLRRGFATAGAQNLIATLWPVWDLSTNEFYGRFYQHLIAGETVAAAHRLALVELLDKVREEEDEFAYFRFVMSYGAFIHCQLPHIASVEAN